MKLLERVVLILAVSLCLPASVEAKNIYVSDLADTSVRNKLLASVEWPTWQIRRKQFAETIRGVQDGNESAIRELDGILSECKSDPFRRNPLENMEILGVYYVPKDGVEPVFNIIVMHAVMGWYDAIRFGSPGVQAKLYTTDRFFLKAFLLGGDRVVNDALQFVKSDPERLQRILKEGINLAEKYRDVPDYDHEWPAEYGIHRVIAAMSGEPFKSSEKMPKEQWDKAWLDSKQFVTKFYMEECSQYLEAINKRNQAR